MLSNCDGIPGGADGYIVTGCAISSWTLVCLSNSAIGRWNISSNGSANGQDFGSSKSQLNPSSQADGTPFICLARGTTRHEATILLCNMHDMGSAFNQSCRLFALLDQQRPHSPHLTQPMLIFPPTKQVRVFASALHGTGRPLCYVLSRSNTYIGPLSFALPLSLEKYGLAIKLVRGSFLFFSLLPLSLPRSFLQLVVVLLPLFPPLSLK